MDLDTFFTELYVMVDDWYKMVLARRINKHAGAVAEMSDSEVLTIMLAGQWQVGVPWRSERGIVRWLERHGRSWFPRMLKRSAFNRRGRWLWGAFVVMQEWLGEELGCEEAAYECVDGTPVPAYSSGQALREAGHWLWESQRGHGGTGGGWFIGDRLLASVTDSGVMTGWVLGAANLNERWLLEAFLSARAGQAVLVGPPPDTKHSRGDLTPPVARRRESVWQALPGRPWLQRPALADPLARRLSRGCAERPTRQRGPALAAHRPAPSRFLAADY